MTWSVRIEGERANVREALENYDHPEYPRTLVLYVVDGLPGTHVSVVASGHDVSGGKSLVITATGYNREGE